MSTELRILQDLLRIWLPPNHRNFSIFAGRDDDESEAGGALVDDEDSS